MLDVTDQENYKLKRYEISLCICQNGYHKKNQQTSAGEYVEKKEPLYIVGEIVNWAATMENSIKFLRKNKNRIVIWPSNSTSEYLTIEIQNTNSKRYMYHYVCGRIICNSQEIEAT